MAIQLETRCTWLGYKTKPRLVARGYKWREGVEFGEAFAPTVSSKCVRFFSAIVCEFGMDMYHSDIEQALLQSKLDEDVFQRLLKECGSLFRKILQLNKRLYGLEQSLRSWHAHLTSCLKTL